MKFMLKIFLLLSLLPAALGARELEPKLNKFEAQVVKEAAAESDAKARAEIFERALQSDSASAGLFFNAANSFASLGDSKKAELYYSKAAELLPTFYLAYRNLAYVEFNEKKYDGACENFSKALSLSAEESAKILPALAQCHFELKRYSEALTCLENAAALSPKESENSLKLRALCLRELGERNKLRDACSKLIALSPRNPLYWRLLVGLNMDEKNYDEAISGLEAMRLAKIAEPVDEELLADLYMNASMFKKACEIYLKRPLGAEKSHKAALVLAYNGFADEAAQLLPNLKKDGAEYWEVLALIKIQKSQDAGEELEKAYSKNPLNQKIAIMLADSKLDKRDYEQAELLYRAAAKSYPLESALGLAKILALKGKYPEAAGVLKEAAAKFNKPELLKYAEKLENL